MTIKRFLSLILLVPVLFCCKPQHPDIGTDPSGKPNVNPVDPGYDDPVPDPYRDAAPELKSGSTVLATNRNVQKFLARRNSAP